MDLEKQEKERQLGVDAVEPGESAPRGLSAKFPGGEFAWRDVSYSVRTKEGEKQILSNVSGCVGKGSSSRVGIYFDAG